MKPITTTALALVLAIPAAPAAAQYGSQPSTNQNYGAATRGTPAPTDQQAAQNQKGPKPSAKALKALIELQDAVNKNDVANIPAKIAAAQAVAQTKEDRYLIARLQLQAAVAAKNNAAIGAAVDAVAASNYLDAKQLSDLYVGLGGAYYNDKQYPQAAAAYQKALAIYPQSGEAADMLGQALLSGGQKAEAAAAYQRMLEARLASGQKPEEALYKRALSVAYDAQSPTAIDLARQWVAAYPTPSSWSDAIAIYRNYNKGDEETSMDLLRLKLALGILTPGEYDDLASLAADHLLFGEAHAVLEAGIAANKINPASPDQRDIVAGIRSKAKPTAADLAAAMKIAANGKALMRIGDNYAAIGDYSNAVAAYKASIAKPDGDAALANLHIGMALARAGDKAGATAALNSVTGARAGIAKYWLTYITTKG